MSTESEKKTVSVESGTQIELNETSGSENLVLQDKMGSTIKMDYIGNIIIEAKGNVIIKSGMRITLADANNGYNGAARKEDKTKSTAIEDPTFWNWLDGLIKVFNMWMPVPQDGGAALKIALTTYLQANPVPSELTGKIIEGSNSVKIGD